MSSSHQTLSSQPNKNVREIAKQENINQKREGDREAVSQKLTNKVGSCWGGLP